MTESEIMKALECCKNINCNGCTYRNTTILCVNALLRDSLDLLNRKNAENERLCGEIDELIIAKDQLFDEAEALIKKARAEAIKEFAERVKEYKYQSADWSHGEHPFVVEVDDIDQIAKEMGVETDG